MGDILVIALVKFKKASHEHAKLLPLDTILARYDSAVSSGLYLNMTALSIVKAVGD